jgi:hypothetical protein
MGQEPDDYDNQRGSSLDNRWGVRNVPDPFYQATAKACAICSPNPYFLRFLAPPLQPRPLRGLFLLREETCFFFKGRSPYPFLMVPLKVR